MVRSLAAFGFAAILATGCVPVTEPVGDVTKAEADKALVGTWIDDNKDEFKIEAAPEVKGNPKGLMRISSLNEKRKGTLWLFVSTVGDRKYGNLFFPVGKKDIDLDLSTEGAYEKWTNAKTRAYVVFQYTTAKDEITLNFGDDKAFKAIATDAKFPKKDDAAFETPAGWLGKYLEKNADKIYPVGTADKLTRKK